MLARLEQIVRSIAFYAVFYFGSVFYVLITLASQLVGGYGVQSIAAGWSRYHRACARYLLGIRLKVEGTLPASGVLVAMKHEAFYEAIDMPALFTSPVVFAKAELMRMPLWGRAAAAYGLISVERADGAKALREMLTAARKHVAAGRILAIFPEGTRIAHGSQAPLQSGFAGLYKLLNLPVVPLKTRRHV